MSPVLGQAELQDATIMTLHSNVCWVRRLRHGACPQSLAWAPFVYEQLFLAHSLGGRIPDLIKLSPRTLKVLFNCLSDFLGQDMSGANLIFNYPSVKCTILKKDLKAFLWSTDFEFCYVVGLFSCELVDT